MKTPVVFAGQLVHREAYGLLICAGVMSILNRNYSNVNKFRNWCEFSESFPLDTIPIDEKDQKKNSFHLNILWEFYG